MKVNYQLLKRAAQREVVTEDQVDQLWNFLEEESSDIPSFRLTHILYYFGGMIAITAMSLFMNIGWESFGGAGIFLISVAYACIGVFLTEFFLRQRRLEIPAGITAAFTVVLVPLAIYGIQARFGFWEDGTIYRNYHQYIDWRWTIMEVGTLIAGAVMLTRYRLPFLVMPIAFTLWYMSMDLAPFLTGAEHASWSDRKMVSLLFGLLVIGVALFVEVKARTDKDYTFWLYLFGTMAFWSGLSTMNSDSEVGEFFYFSVNVFMILFGAMISRRVFVVFGAIGAFGYVSYLAYDVFENAMLFPFAMTLIGVSIIYLGIWWQRHEQELSGYLRARLPESLREAVERRK